MASNRGGASELMTLPDKTPASVQPSGDWAGTYDCLQAMEYVTRHRRIRRLRGVAGKPWELLTLILAVVLVAAGEIAALLQSTATQGAYLTHISTVLRIAPLMLALVIGRATFRSPLRVSVAEVSWLLTAPGGTRAAFIWKLMARPVQAAIAGYLGTILARWWVGLPVGEAWRAVLAGAIIGLAVRLASFGSYIATVRAHAGGVLRAIALLWALALVVALVNVPGREWIELRPATDKLAIAILDPPAASTNWILIFLAVLLAVAALLAVVAGDFEEQAELSARQAAHAQTEMRRTRSGQEVWATQFRTGLPSLPAWPALAGAGALFYRTLAQERRILRYDAGTVAVVLAFTLILRVFLPSYAWLPVALLLLAAPTALGAADGLAVELDHYHLRLAPLRPLPAIIWVTIIPVVRVAVMAEILWLPLITSPNISAETWVAGIILIPFVVILAANAGTFAIASADGALARVLLGIGASLLNTAPAAALIVTTRSLVPIAALLLVVTAALVVPSFIWIALTPRAVWGAH